MCRDMGYPWAEGSSRLDKSSVTVSPAYSLTRLFPDYCPGIEDGFASECISYDNTDAVAEHVIISCRSKI